MEDRVRSLIRKYERAVSFDTEEDAHYTNLLWAILGDLESLLE